MIKYIFKIGLFTLLTIFIAACGTPTSSYEVVKDQYQAKLQNKKNNGNSKLGKNAVATAHPLATQAALETLEKGGNAFDAAVVASAVLAVVEPSGSGMGGGGFWLLHRESDGKQVMIDGRETAPAAAHRDMYLDANKQVIKGVSLNGPLAAGIPGQAAALDHISKQYGNLTLSQNLQAAIKFADQGVAANEHIVKHLNFRSKIFNTEAKRLFLKEGEVPTVGTVIKQPELATTLELLAKQGRRGFYQGEVAQKMVDSVRNNGGIWTLEDLKNYKIIEREPVKFDYKGNRIVAANLPSSGGIVLGQIMQTIELKQKTEGDKKAPTMHLFVEAMRRAYRDRSLYLGDSDFVKVDEASLLSPAYLQKFVNDIGDKATLSADLSTTPNLGVDTTHFSIIDRDGNRVAATLSINYPFGSGHIAEGTGVFLNNEMDDFVSKAGEPNVYGLVGGKANQIEPGKRPLSSMTPTFIETDNGAIAIGTPGGSRIISMVALAMSNIVDRNMSLQQAIDAPRYHHQYLPDAIQLEKGSSYLEVPKLIEKGHQFKRLNRQYGNMHAVSWENFQGKVVFEAASDSRGEGQAIVK